jgi:hypothetical protein
MSLRRLAESLLERFPVSVAPKAVGDTAHGHARVSDDDEQRMFHPYQTHFHTAVAAQEPRHIPGSPGLESPC